MSDISPPEPKAHPEEAHHSELVTSRSIIAALGPQLDNEPVIGDQGIAPDCTVTSCDCEQLIGIPAAHSR